jgi:hypothetical protein
MRPVRLIVNVALICELSLEADERGGRVRVQQTQDCVLPGHCHLGANKACLLEMVLAR